MGRALEIVTAADSATAVTAGTYVALTANSGQSFTIRQANGTPAAEILGPWAQFAGAGKLQIKSPRLHDTTIGDTFHVQVQTAFGAGQPLLDPNDSEPGYSTDVLIVQYTTDVSITTTTTHAAAIPIYYSDLPGIDANYMTWAQVQSYINPTAKTGSHYTSWVAPSSSGTAGNIGTGVLINATNDQFKAGHSYALLGYMPSAVCCSVLLQGTDTGNLYTGGPGVLDVKVTRQWFVDLAIAQNLPLIPIVQANNKGATNVFVQDNATTSTAFVIGLHWMDLGIIGVPVGV